MALFCSPCYNVPIIFLKPQRNYVIQTPFMPKTSILKPPTFEIAKNSISPPPKFIADSFIRTAKCISNLSSPGEFDKVVPSNAIVFIKGLAQSTSQGSLKVAFSRYGQVERVKIVRDKKTKDSLGFAYVWFADEEHARASADDMNGKFFEGRFIHVSIAKPESCKTRPKPSPYKF